MDDLANPYFLYQSDNPGLVLVSQPLTGDNYASWSCAMEHALSIKNKLRFIDGSLLRLGEDDPQMLGLRTHSNNIVVSWIFNAVSKNIVGSIMRSKIAAEIWKDLRERYQQKNGPRIFELCHNLMSLSQGNDSVSAYFTKLKTIWDELSAYKPIATCTCGGLSPWLDNHDAKYVMSFLMGLYDHFSSIRGL